MKDVDPMNMLSGTTEAPVWWTQCSSLIESSATLFCTGRDIESQKLGLELDSTTHIWKLVSDGVAEEVMLIDHVIQAVADFMPFSSGSFTGTSSQLAEAMEKIDDYKRSFMEMKHQSDATDIHTEEDYGQLGCLYFRLALDCVKLHMFIKLNEPVLLPARQQITR